MTRGLAIAIAVAAASLAACRDEPRPPPREIAPPACTGAIAGTGVATHYDATGAGRCSFEPAPAERLVAALNAADYDRAAWCGACLDVAGPLGAVVVRVVDRCGGCKHGDLDLSREAFARIAPLSDGRTAITWRVVACPVTGPVVYRIKPRSNAQWTAIQLRNHRYPIARLEARGRDAAYRAMSRTDDNYFVAPRGLGPGPYALRVTDVHGHALHDAGIPLAAGEAHPGAAQFPSCP